MNRYSKAFIAAFIGIVLAVGTVVDTEARGNIWSSKARRALESLINSQGEIDLGAIISASPLGVAGGGTGVASILDGSPIWGSGTGAVTAGGVLGDGEFIVGDGAGDPVYESGATLRTSIGVGTGDAPTFAGLTLTEPLNISTTDADGIVFGSLGTATIGIDLSSSGLSGNTDYLFYFSGTNYWRADGVVRFADHLITGYLDSNLISPGSATAGIRLATKANSAVLIGDPTVVGTITDAENTGNIVIAKAAHGLTITPGMMLHLIDVTTAADEGFYQIDDNGDTITDTTIAFADTDPDTITDSNNGFVTAGFLKGHIITVTGTTSNNTNFTVASVVAGTLTLVAGDTVTAEGAGASVTLDSTANVIEVSRVLTGDGDGDVDFTVYKDVVAMFATDGTNGQLLRGYSAQDKPLQIGGDTLVATGHSLGAEGVLFAGKTEFDGQVDVDGEFLIYTKSKHQDNAPGRFGNSEDMEFMWDTNGANDDIGVLNFLESNGTNIPILVVSDASFAPDGDATFDDITDPSIAIMNDAGDKHGRFYHDNTDFVIDTDSGKIKFLDDVQLAATQKLYLDGGGDTYIDEISADVLSATVGGQEAMRITEAASVATVRFTSQVAGFAIVNATSLGRLDFFGDDDTASADEIAGQIESISTSTWTDGAEDAKMVLSAVNDGTLNASQFVLNADGSISVKVATFNFTTEIDLTIASTVVRLDGDNDGDADTIDLQNGTSEGQDLELVAFANIDVDDPVTINYGDTTCTNCPATVFDKLGENAKYRWLGAAWILLSIVDAL